MSNNGINIGQADKPQVGLGSWKEKIPQPFVELQPLVANIRTDAETRRKQFEALKQVDEILQLSNSPGGLAECVETLVENVLLASVHILRGDGGLLYVREESPVPMKRVIAAVEDKEVIAIPQDPRFQHFEKPIPIEGAGKLIWQMLSERDDFWLTAVDNPILPKKLVDWHKSLGHKWLAHFMLRRDFHEHGFLVIAFREERVLDPLTAQIGKILSHQVTMAFELMGRSRAAREAAVMEARADLYRDIHDTLGQGLAGIAMQLGAASRLVGRTSAAVTEHINIALDLARESLAIARRNAESLDRADISPMGLAQQIEQYVLSARRLTAANFKVTLETIATSLPLRVEHQLLRIAREAIHNSIKHSGAQNIAITLSEMKTGGIRLSVEDDGIGFDPSLRSRGMGLENIRQRAANLDADLTLITEVGLGTSLIIVLPGASNETSPGLVSSQEPGSIEAGNPLEQV